MKAGRVTLHLLATVRRPTYAGKALLGIGREFGISDAADWGVLGMFAAIGIGHAGLAVVVSLMG